MNYRFKKCFPKKGEVIAKTGLLICDMDKGKETAACGYEGR